MSKDLYNYFKALRRGGFSKNDVLVWDNCLSAGIVKGACFETVVTIES